MKKRKEKRRPAKSMCGERDKPWWRWHTDKTDGSNMGKVGLEALFEEEPRIHNLEAGRAMGAVCSANRIKSL